MATSEEEFHAQCLQRFLDLANTINGEGIDSRIVSSGLMTASAIYATYTLAGNEGKHDRDEGKGCSLDDRKPSAHRANADRLQQSGHPGKEHRHLDHVDHLWEVGAVRAETETRRASDDDRGRHVSNEHREDVLDA